MTSRGATRGGAGGGGGVSSTPDAAGVTFTPAGSIAATNVQDALVELDGTIPDASQFTYATGGGKEAVAATGTSGTVTIDLNDGNYQYATLTGNVTSTSVTNVTNGKACSLFLEITAGANSWTWWSGITWVGLTSAPTLSTSGTDLFSFVTRDGGTTWFGFYLTGSAPTQSKDYSISGALTTSTGALRLYNNSGRTRTLSVVRASVGTAPTGASILVDVNKNGTTIFTTQSKRPTIAVSTNTDLSDTPDVTSWADGDYLTVDVDQIGSSVAGSNLVVQVVYYDG